MLDAIYDIQKEQIEKAYQQGRKDAIDEYSYQLKNTKLYLDGIPQELVDALEIALPMIAFEIEEYLLKEKKNEV